LYFFSLSVDSGSPAVTQNVPVTLRKDENHCFVLWMPKTFPV